jgi:hypothetical protein
MVLIKGVAHLGLVEGLGDEEIPWWIAPYVRDFIGLAKSSAVLRTARAPESVTTSATLAALAARVAQTAAVARVAKHTQNGGQLAAGVNASIAADVDEFCGTPPRPHHIGQAALVVATLAASLEEADPAKAALVGEAQRLQAKLT